MLYAWNHRPTLRRLPCSLHLGCLLNPSETRSEGRTTGDSPVAGLPRHAALSLLATGRGRIRSQTSQKFHERCVGFRESTRPRESRLWDSIISGRESFFGPSAAVLQSSAAAPGSPGIVPIPSLCSPSRASGTGGAERRRLARPRPTYTIVAACASECLGRRANLGAFGPSLQKPAAVRRGVLRRGAPVDHARHRVRWGRRRAGPTTADLPESEF